jgi:hypothetical protein
MYYALVGLAIAAALVGIAVPVPTPEFPARPRTSQSQAYRLDG